MYLQVCALLCDSVCNASSSFEEKWLWHKPKKSHQLQVLLVVIAPRITMPKVSEHTERLSKSHAKTNQSIRRLQEKLEEALERRGLEVDEALHGDLCATISQK